MCYILYKIDPMYCTMMWEKKGSGGCLAPPIWKVCEGSGQEPLRKTILVIFGGFLAHGFC
jgi:hypothetical protein